MDVFKHGHRLACVANAVERSVFQGVVAPTIRSDRVKHSVLRVDRPSHSSGPEFAGQRNDGSLSPVIIRIPVVSQDLIPASETVTQPNDFSAQRAKAIRRGKLETTGRIVNTPRKVGHGGRYFFLRFLDGAAFQEVGPHAIIIALLYLQYGGRWRPDSFLWTDKKYTILTCSHCHGIAQAAGEQTSGFVPWLLEGRIADDVVKALVLV